MASQNGFSLNVFGCCGQDLDGGGGGHMTGAKRRKFFVASIILNGFSFFAHFNDNPLPKAPKTFFPHAIFTKKIWGGRFELSSSSQTRWGVADSVQKFVGGTLLTRFAWSPKYVAITPWRRRRRKIFFAFDDRFIWPLRIQNK